MQIRTGMPSDLAALTRLCAALWPDEAPAEHREHAAAILAGSPRSSLPVVLIVAEVDAAVVGFIEVGLRSHADGCDERHPVGFVEGWYVETRLQRQGIGRALMGAAEAWARTQGAEELASDTWVDSKHSQSAHESLGFEVVDHVVNYRKSLR